ncbi:MAG TPA: hypothetical protein VF341_05760 [Anaeromyxobacteraceae bacterium]
MRFVAWARPACGQIFFLCRHCDRGHRYCSTACARAGRSTSVLAAGRRYQASREGRRGHAERQRRYRERRREKVTHHGRENGALSAMVRASSAASAMEAPPQTGAEASTHVTHHPRAQARRVCCARCGRAGRYLRHETLARAGRPEHQRRFRGPAP